MTFEECLILSGNHRHVAEALQQGPFQAGVLGTAASEPWSCFPLLPRLKYRLPSALFPSPLTRCVDQLERRAGPGGSRALLCRQPSCLQRAAVPGSRSKTPLSSPLSMAGALLGAFVTLPAPSHPRFPKAVCAGTSARGWGRWKRGPVANRLEATVQARHMWTGSIWERCARRGGSWRRG